MRAVNQEYKTARHCRLEGQKVVGTSREESLEFLRAQQKAEWCCRAKNVPLFDVSLAHLAIFVLLLHGRIALPVAPQVLSSATDPFMSSSLIPDSRDVMASHLQSSNVSSHHTDS